MNLETFFERFELFADAPDAVVKIRELILQLAVRGNLVQQDPKEGDAGALLEAIVSARKKNGRHKTVEPGEDIEVPEVKKWYDTPASWRWVRLGMIGHIIGGGTPRSENSEYFADEGIPWLTPADLNGLKEKRILRGRRCITQLGLDNSSAQLLPEGSVVFSSRAPIGYVAIAGTELATNQGFKSCVPFIKETNEFLYYYLMSAAARIDSEASGTTFREVSGKIVSQIPVPLPPVAEQKRIVAKVDELMALCDRLEAQQQERERRHATLARASVARFVDAPTPANLNFIFHKSYDISPTDLCKSILSLAVQGKLVPQDPNDEPVSDLLTREFTARRMLVKQGEIRAEEPLKSIKAEEQPAEIPSGWAWCKIDHLIHSLKNDIRTGPFGSSLHKNEHKAFGVPVWGIESIGKDGSFTGLNKIFVDVIKARELASFSVKGGDIIISRSGTVGELCRLPDGIPAGLISTNLMKISLNTRVINPDYFCLLFRGAISINAQLSQLCFGSSRLFLTQKILTKLLFPVPPLSEQNRIVAKVDELMASVDALETQLINARITAQKLMEAVVAELTSQQSTRSLRCPHQSLLRESM
jgi:type I restriction enzyme S subunit